MDSDCDYPLYSRGEDNREEDDVDYESCLHCSHYWSQAESIRCNGVHNSPEVPFQVARTGRMVPYVEVFEATDQATQAKCKTFERSETPILYVYKGAVISLRGAIHTQDVSPNGTWLSEQEKCSHSLLRLRQGGLICTHMPELNRIVLEQKNDDGLLYLANKWLLNKSNMNEGIELFGPFVCDAMLAPVLHDILRSDWIEERKELGETNNELKLGWAQEFYDWNSVLKNSTGSTLFAHYRKCPIKPNNAHSYRTVTFILDKMRWCGYTPWSAVQAVRCSEGRISGIDCVQCKSRLLASCVFLMECAAVEASRQRDWLVRNEAVIQLCWLLYHIHRPQGCDVLHLLEAWTESTLIHSARYQDYKVKAASSDLEALVVMFANDHLPVVSKTTKGEHPKHRYDNGGPDPNHELLQFIIQNGRFSPKRERVLYPIRNEDDFDISTAVDVLTKAPGDMEARAQEVDVIARALVLCFPRVAASALSDLTLRTPNTLRFSARIWPVFVNSTRACYQLFKALALPVSPSPVYTLELLARGWRCMRPEVLERFIPMSTGGRVKVSYDHYTKHLLGPVNTLVGLRLISESEKTLTVKLLHKGLLPCFAAEGDSVPDRLVSSTIALTFAACGSRVFELAEDDDTTGSHITVTTAGLLYFAAWYALVYIGTLHMHPMLKKRLSRTGSDADKHLCLSLNLEHLTGGSYHCKVLDTREIVQALRIVFRDLLDTDTVLRVAELYVPELLVQLPYAGNLNLIPNSVKSAIESRDRWFVKEHGDGSYLEQNEPPFAYLGPLAHGLHSSIKGSLTRCRTRPIAKSLRGPDSEFDPWCNTLWGCTEDQDSLGLDDSLRMAIKDTGEESYYNSDELEEHHLSAETWLSPELHSQSSEDEAPGVPEREDAINYRRLCKGLLVENVDKLGFQEGHGFLTLAQLTPGLNTRQSVSATLMKTPCMGNIASTVYMKTQGSVDVSTCLITHGTLIEALWVLFMYSTSGSVPTSQEPVSTVNAAPEEPCTPESLAVMVHLAVKSFSLETATVTSLGVCNDIHAMYKGECYHESQFIPITAIVGGLFGVNVEVNVNGFNYYITNQHYHGLWAPGSICYNSGIWYVMVKGLNVPVSIPHEPHRPDCYHKGTLGAYCRLNDLQVVRVPSDNYCGFHTVAALIGLIRANGMCDRDVRKLMVSKTAEYMIRNKDDTGIGVYLKCNNCTSDQGLTDVLMQPDRWLSIDEVKLHAHCTGKDPGRDHRTLLPHL